MLYCIISIFATDIKAKYTQTKAQTFKKQTSFLNERAKSAMCVCTYVVFEFLTRTTNKNMFKILP